MRGKLTLAQFFGIFLLLVATLLAGFFAIVFDTSRKAVSARATELRESAAQRVADAVGSFLTGGEGIVEGIERQIRTGTCSVATLHQTESCLTSAMLAHPEATELALTHATRLGFEENGAPRFSEADHWRVSVFRDGHSDEVPLCIRSTRRSGAQYFNRTRCIPPGEAMDSPAIVTHDEPAQDPASWPGFITPAAAFARGRTLKSDLSYLEIDSGLPESKRRIGFHILRALASPDDELLGVLRLSLLAQEIDDRVMEIHVDEGHEGAPYRTFISDEQGRLITRTCEADLLKDDGEDLRIVTADPVIAAALASPALKELDDESPASSAKVFYGRATYDVTFRILPNTQSWRVGILGPENYFLGADRRALSRFGLVAAGLVGLVLLGGGLALRSTRRGLRQVEAEADRLSRFDFTAQTHRSGFRDLAKVLDTLEHAKTALRGLGKYAPLALVKQLYELNREPVLGGELREVSLLFTDIEEFTALSERLAPDALAERLGRYLEVMATTLQAHEGTVDKFIGDAVMVLWNAPRPCESHAVKACAAVLACVEATRALYARPDWEGEPLVTRFGVHVDRVMVGHFGSPERMSYTAVGDGVNIAARLEALNKQCGTTVLVSDAIRERAQAHFVFRRIDRVAVKGKLKGIEVYELLGPLGTPVSDAARTYEAAFDAYLGRDFTRARSLLSVQLEDGPSRVLHDRCQGFVEQPPPPDWDGTHFATTK